MILGIGTDIVNIERIEKSLEKFGERFERKLFTVAERAVANSRANAGARVKAATYAKRFAAKEAFVKALGTGFADGISWQDIEISQLEGGKPVMNVTGAAFDRLRSLGTKTQMPKIDVSMADDYPIAQAFVIISIG